MAVVGCSGSGKTTLSRALARAVDTPNIELDAIFHQPGWTPLDDDTFQARVTEVTEAARTVVWFDFPFITVMARTVRRTVRRTVTRQELWNGNKEPWSNLFSFNPEKSIIAWAATRHRVYRQRYGEAEHDPRWAGLRFVRLRSQRETDAFLAEATITA